MSLLEWLRPTFVARLEKALKDAYDENDALRKDLARQRKHCRRLERELAECRMREAHAVGKLCVLAAQAARCKCRS